MVPDQPWQKVHKILSQWKKARHTGMHLSFWLWQKHKIGSRFRTAWAKSETLSPK
jgi:hypothetical protein